MWSKFSRADEPDSNMAFSGKKIKNATCDPRASQRHIPYMLLKSSFKDICGIQVMHKPVFGERFHAS